VSFSFDHLLTSLAKANPKDELRVLLVASDVDGNLPRAADELRQVREHIQAGCDLIDLQPRFVTVPPEEASVKEVESQLIRNGPFQLFHYAGHARHPSEDPAASGIVLLGANNEPEVVTCRRLSRLLKGRGLWLVYLSSCQSSAASGSNLGLSPKYVGTMEAVVEAGVPNVVGFRCMVSDQGAFHLASEFYRQLFEIQTEKNLNLAMLEARRSVEDLPDRFDAWASAMLITQYS
jgi:CHAT domain-containing protein